MTGRRLPLGLEGEAREYWLKATDAGWQCCYCYCQQHGLTSEERSQGSEVTLTCALRLPVDTMYFGCIMNLPPVFCVLFFYSQLATNTQKYMYLLCAVLYARTLYKI